MLAIMSGTRSSFLTTVCFYTFFVYIFAESGIKNAKYRLICLLRVKIHFFLKKCQGKTHYLKTKSDFSFRSV